MIYFFSTAAGAFEVPPLDYVWPSASDVNGGTLVSLAGSAFAAIYNKPALRVGCKFDTEYVTAQFVTRDVVQCRTPAHVQGIIHISFTVNNETAACEQPAHSDAASLEDHAAAAVRGLFPPAGSVGTPVWLAGDHFRPGMRCRFGAADVGATFVSSALLLCVVPPAPGPGDSVLAQLSNGVGDFPPASAEGIEFALSPGPPALSHLQPAAGPERGGSLVLATGSGFAYSSSLRCKFGSRTVSARWLSPSEIHCISPAADPGAGGQPLAAAANAIRGATGLRLNDLPLAPPVILAASDLAKAAE